MQKEVLSGKYGTEQGDNYLAHEMIFLPMNLQSLHWYLAVVNTHKREIQILDSMLDHEDRLELRQTLLGMEAHVNLSLRMKGAQNSNWPDSLLSKWPVFVKKTPQRSDGCSCGLFVLKNMESWTGDEHTDEFKQVHIDKFGRELPAMLVSSPLNKLRKRYLEATAKMDEDSKMDQD
ncbi:uncharacterized protein [Triticum aestivum]|uniref:uncharacterized protein n=1 Tax=Triticum aestivum TaxID=4565 RepID=UPI001D020937|nr:uncharacterized protein LOC123123594 [Triticum aestivum]